MFLTLFLLTTASVSGAKYNENSLEEFPISPPISDSIKNYDISFYENYPLEVTLEFTAEGDDDQDIEYAKVLENEDWATLVEKSYQDGPAQIHLILLMLKILITRNLVTKPP